MVLALAAARTAGAQSGGDASALERVQVALEAAVRSRLAPDATIIVERLQVRWAGDPPVEALTVVPEPAQRLGGPMRFVIYDEAVAPGRRPVGVAQAAVRATLGFVRTARRLERGARIGVGDVTAVRDDLGRRPLESLPPLGEVVGSIARRAFKAGDTVTAMTIRRAPLVNHGDELILRARVGEVEATARAVASELGDLGDVIRVMNADTRRVLKAEVVGPGEVEVRHVR